MHTLIIGAGYSGLHIATHARAHGTVCGTRRSPDALSQLKDLGVETLVLSGLAADAPLDAQRNALDSELLYQLGKVTHLVICAAPDRQTPFTDPVLRLFTHEAIAMPNLCWIGYLSTIGVYGDHAGQWIDESTPCSSIQTRSLMRKQAEEAWRAMAEQHKVSLTILRLSGIYGPERNAVEDAIKGRARVLTKAGQVFNRIHVTDLANATVTAALAQYDGVLNITDNEPAAPEDIVAFAHQLAGKPMPPAVDVNSADISEMARSFYSENKRVSNALGKQALGLQYQYPTYREGLEALWNYYCELSAHQAQS